MRVWRAVMLLLLMAMAGVPAVAEPDTCGPYPFCSKKFLAKGQCTSHWSVPILEPAWEDRPIRIIGLTLGLRLHGRRLIDIIRWIEPSGTVFAGNSFNTDVMALKIGPGEKDVWFPEGQAFLLPAKETPDNPHIHVDIHLECTKGTNYTAWMILYYPQPQFTGR